MWRAPHQKADAGWLDWTVRKNQTRRAGRPPTSGVEKAIKRRLACRRRREHVDQE
jgi:hypothetical protein